MTTPAVPTADALTVADRIRHLDPCQDALDWATDYTSPADAWKACERPDWMLWILGVVDRSAPGSPSRRSYAAIAAACARLCLDHFEKQFPNDDRPRKAIELCERYAAGADISLDDLRRTTAAAWNAADAAWNAADAAGNAADAAGNAAAAAGNAAAAAGNAAAAAWNAADAAWNAADAAGNAAVAAGNAAVAAGNAAAAAGNAAAADARKAINKQMCDIVRGLYPNPPEVSRE